MHLSGFFPFPTGLWRVLTQRAKSSWQAGALRLVAVALLPVVAVACGGSDGGSKPAAGGAAASGAKVTKKVTFMAGFKPQANLPFVGVYVAQEKGFFKDEALEVDIKHA